MIRSVIATILGVATWVAVATTLNLLLRNLYPGYPEAEPAMTFTFGMLLARLVLAALSTVAAGAVTASIARAARPVYALAVLLVLVFVPMHVGLWQRFPVWYHLVFLLSLAPLAVAGGTLATRRGAL